jgi:hypothetical protein
VTTALSHASHLLHISKLLTSDTDVARDPDLHACASQYLQELSKALIDDAVKVLGTPESKALNRGPQKSPRIAARAFYDSNDQCPALCPPSTCRISPVTNAALSR